MTSIPIGKRVYTHQPVFKPYGDFIITVCFVFYPISAIIKEDLQLLFNEILVDPYILICFSEGARPFPHFREHPSVYFFDKSNCKNFF